jgi:hypothetical protein
MQKGTPKGRSAQTYHGQERTWSVTNDIHFARVQIHARIRAENEQRRSLWDLHPAPQEIHCRRGYKGAGEDIRGKHGKDYRLCGGGQTDSELLRPKEHGEEDDTVAECRDQGRHRNLGRAIKDGLTLAMPFFAKALNILNRHRGIVYEDAHCQREAAEGHGVDRLSQHAQNDPRTENRTMESKRR